MTSVLPDGFTPYFSISDGNCLFSSISVCLFGDTANAAALRFASLAHGVKHFPHYLKMVCSQLEHVKVITCTCLQLCAEIATDEDALQFLSTVASDDDVFINRPSGDRNIILRYSMESELVSTSRIGSYSGIINVDYLTCVILRYYALGLLQIMFLAGAINFRIQQHTEVPRYSYDTILSPCSCSKSVKGTVHIMWVKSSREAVSMNHIIPLIPGIHPITQ